MTQAISLSRCAFLLAPRALRQATARKTPAKSMIPKSVHGFPPSRSPLRRAKEGRIRSCSLKRGRSAERRGVDSAGPPTSVAACPVRSSRRALPFGKRARLPALYRGSCQRLVASAQSGPALHGSGQPIRSPGSQLLADRRRGRPGEFPNRPNAVCETAPGHRSRSTFRIASGMCPWTSEMDSFSSPRSANSRNSAGTRHPSDVTRIFFRFLFGGRAQKL